MYFLINFWVLIYFYNKYTFKLSNYINRNYLSFFHSFFTTLILYFYHNELYENSIDKKYLNYITHYLSVTYFIWDTLFILYYNIKNKNLKEILYIYHHCVCLLALNQTIYNINKVEINKLFFYGEASNFFNYIVYHAIKYEYSQKYIILFKTLQIINFSYFRIFLFSEMIFSTLYLIKNRFLALNLFIIYILGLFWGIKQIKSFIISLKFQNKIAIK